MVTYGIFLSFFFTCVCPSINCCHDSGRCTGAAAQRLALAVAVAVNSFRDVRFELLDEHQDQSNHYTYLQQSPTTLLVGGLEHGFYFPYIGNKLNPN